MTTTLACLAAAGGRADLGVRDFAIVEPFPYDVVARVYQQSAQVLRVRRHVTQRSMPQTKRSVDDVRTERKTSRTRMRIIVRFIPLGP